VDDEENRLEAKVRRELSEMNAEFGHRSPPAQPDPLYNAPASPKGLSTSRSMKSMEPVSPAGSVVVLAQVTTPSTH